MFSNNLLTFLLIVINFIFLLFASTFVIVGIHIVIDHGLILEITNGSIYLTGTYILIFCGFIMLMTLCIGLYGIIKGDRFLMIAFIVLLIFLILFHFIGGILLLAYPSSVNDDVKNTMRTTLRDQYGKTRLYTDAWNLTQSKLRCCGVDDLGWSVYRDSYWDNVTNIDLNNRELKIQVSNSFYLMVPPSCCWQLVDPQTGWPGQQFRDVPRCQYFQFGPPNQKSGANNDALNYRGCANAMKSFLGMYARGVGGLAIFFIFVMIGGVVLVVIKLIHSTEEAKQRDRLDIRTKDPINEYRHNNGNNNGQKSLFLPGTEYHDMEDEYESN